MSFFLSSISFVSQLFSKTALAKRYELFAESRSPSPSLSVSFGNASRTESQTFGKTRLHQRVSFGNRRNDAPETRRSQDKIQTFQCRKLKGSCLERRNLRRVSRLPTSCIFQLPHRLALSVEYRAFRC